MANFQLRVPPGLGAMLLFAGVLAWMFWPVLLGEATFVHGDALSVSLPLQKLLASALGEGRIPQWSNAIYGGHPVLAEGQGGFLHPLNLLLFGTLPRLFDVPGAAVGAGTLYAHGLLHLLCTWVAAWGCFGLARALGLGIPAALFAGLSLAFSQDWLGLSGNSAIALSVCFVPLAAWAAERWWQAPGLRTACALGAAVALMLLAGYPQAVHAFAIGMAVVFAVRSDARFWRSPASHLWTGLLAVAVAAGLASMQLLPTLELVGESVRSEGVELAYAGSPLRQLRGLLFSGGRLNVVEPGLGSLLVLFLAGLGLAASRARLAWAAAALLLLQLGIAEHSPLYRLLDGVLPGLDSFRITHLYSTVALVGVAILAGFGAQRIADLAHAPAPRVLWLQGGLVAVVLAGATLLARHDELRAVSWAFPLLAALAIAARAGLARRRAGLLVLLLLVEIAVLREPLHDFVSADVASRPPPTADFLRDRHPGVRDFRIANVPHFFSYIGFAPPDTAKLAHLARLFLASLDAGSNLLWDVPSLNANLALPLARRAAVSSLVEREVRGEGARPRGARFIDLEAVRYVVARERQQATPYAKDLRRVFYDPETRFFVVENEAAAGRMRLLPLADLQWVPDFEAALASFDAPDGRLAVLEGTPPPAGPAVTGYGASIAWGELSDERIEVEVEGAEAVYLVVADAPYPGWTARVDGASVPIAPANLLGKAVPVPAGRHRVVLEFRSGSFVRGLAVSAATLVALAGAFLWMRVRRQRVGR